MSDTFGRLPNDVIANIVNYCRMPIFSIQQTNKCINLVIACGLMTTCITLANLFIHNGVPYLYSTVPLDMFDRVISSLQDDLTYSFDIGGILFCSGPDNITIRSDMHDITIRSTKESKQSLINVIKALKFIYVETPVWSGNIAIGARALLANTTESNVAIGHHTLFANTTGSDNVAFGSIRL